jgi:hypothetical protein
VAGAALEREKFFGSFFQERTSVLHRAGAKLAGKVHDTFYASGK